jgi:hypothetical protein
VSRFSCSFLCVISASSALLRYLFPSLPSFSSTGYAPCYVATICTSPSTRPRHAIPCPKTIPCYNVFRQYCGEFRAAAKLPLFYFRAKRGTANLGCALLSPSLNEPTVRHPSNASRICRASRSRPTPCGLLQPRRNISKQMAYKSFRMIFFAHPHPLTLIESHSCKKQGEGVVHRLAYIFKVPVPCQINARNWRKTAPQAPPLEPHP